mgnify:CR=1 FL=1
MNFIPEEKTIKDLLVSGHQFEIPRFQRAYSWEKRHYAEFLRDILSNLTVSDGKISANPYFVGTMLFIGNFVDANKNVIKVVDGQQRLTTITILFSVLSDLFKMSGDEALAKRIFTYIMAEDDDNKSERILKTKSNYPYFAYYIQEYQKEYNEKPKSEEEENIRQTYEYFYKCLQEKKLHNALKQNNGAAAVNNLQYIDILKAIRDQVLACTFISISTSSIDQANRIFEILNAKGKRLDEVDLIKNAIFEILDDEEPADYANDHWTDIRKTIEDLDSGVGMSTYYRHFWAAVYKKTGSGKLYVDFKKTINSSRQSYKDFLEQMKNYANLYVQIINPKLEYYDNRQEYQWLVQSMKALTDTFSIVQVRVPLMALLDAKKRGVLSMAMFKKCIMYLENFHFAFNVIVSDRGNKLDSIYSKFAIELHKAQGKDTSNVLVSRLIEDLDGLFPSYPKFRDEFVKMQFRKESMPSNVKTKYALYKLNAYFSGNEVFPTNLSVEHIYPESETSTSYNIGNLILLETNLNHEADKSDYDKKKRIYKKSKEKWVLEFLDKNPSWDIGNFVERANELATIYYKEIFGKPVQVDNEVVKRH